MNIILFQSLQDSPASRLVSRMSDLACPICTVDDVTEHAALYECMTCGHEWEKDVVKTDDGHEQERVVKDAYGNVLESGDIVAMVKDLKLKGTSKVLKSGMKSKPIRIVEGDHEIDCKMDGLSIALKACFVKKVLS
ncbi:MAG: zinc ribbon domain-containing protein YjdM [Akkermansiaceae bacterium]